MAVRQDFIRNEDNQRSNSIYDSYNRGEDYTFSYIHVAHQIGVKRQTVYAIVRSAESRDGEDEALQRSGHAASNKRSSSMAE